MPRLASALPKEADQNGLHAIARELLIDPLKRHVVIAVVDCSKITTDTGTGSTEATVRVLRIEQVHPDDRTEAERLIRRAVEYRSHGTVLPLDIERDLEELFGKGVTVDTTTGVVTVPSDAGPDDDDRSEWTAAAGDDVVDLDAATLYDLDEDDEGGDDDDDAS